MSRNFFMPYLSPPKKNKFHLWNFRKKNHGFHRQIESPKFAIPSAAAPMPLLPWWQIFENPMGSPTKSQVSPFPRIVHIPFCQSWQFFSWNFRRNGCEGNGVFSKMCFVSGCGGNTQSEFKAMSITWWFNKAPSNSRLWANHASFVGGKTCEVQGALVVCMFYLYIPPISDMTASCVSLIPLQWARLLKLNRRKYKG